MKTSRTTTITKVWKVVASPDKTSIYARMDRWKVKYKRNVWVRSRVRGTKLFCFAELEDAEHYVRMHTYLGKSAFCFELEIWEAWAEDVEESKLICSYPSEDKPMTDFYSSAQPSYTRYDNWNGSLMADRIKLIQKVG